MKAAGIILAAGKGKRFGATGINKTASLFNGKPMVHYGVELFTGVCESTVVVVGVMADTVKAALADTPNILFAYQAEPLGTGDAFRVGIKALVDSGKTPDVVLVGYGDHMMFYDKRMLDELTALHESSAAAVTMVTVQHDEPDTLAWGRIVRNEQGNVQRIVEQKDATDEERKIDELNAGFYCVDFSFAKEKLDEFAASPVTGEYYLTDIVQMAVKDGKTVSGLTLPLTRVGIGVNTPEEKSESEALFGETHLQ